MLLQPDCISCILKMAISLLRKLSLTEEQVKRLYLEILELPSLKGKNWNITSPEIIQEVMEKIVDATGDPDPFAAQKNQLNKTVSDRYAFYQEQVERSVDPLYSAVKLAIAGNAIDFMVPQRRVDIDDTILKIVDAPLPGEWFSLFTKKMETVTSILYFGDNCGEVVLDKLLIETLQKKFDVNITFVVRSFPTLNDVTVKEAVSIGMDQVVDIVENGIQGPLPGTIFNRCSAQIRSLVEKTDVIISKGGGNYDTLGEEKKYLNKIVFLFLSKCYPYNRDFDVSMFQPILSVAL